MKWLHFLLVPFLLASCAKPLDVEVYVPSDELKVMSLNARDWSRDLNDDSPYFWRVRMRAMKRMLLDVNPDVICFQELVYPANLYIPDSYRSVGVCVSTHLYCKVGMSVKDTCNLNLHYLLAEIEGIKIASVHGTWKESMGDSSNSLIDKLSGRFVIAGDFNVSIDKCHEYGFGESVRESLCLDEVDTFTNFKRPEESHGEIDHFFCGDVQPISYEIIKDGYGAERISDHYPIVATFRIN